MNGRERSVQDVVNALVSACPLDGGDAGGFFDNADEALVAGRTGTVDAGIHVGDVIADGAKAEGGFEAADGIGQRGGIVVG